MYDDEQPRPIKFGIRNYNEPVALESWAYDVVMYKDLQAAARPEHMRRDGNRIFMTVANGDAEYLVIGEDVLVGTFTLRLVRSTFTPLPA